MTPLYNIWSAFRHWGGHSDVYSFLKYQIPHTHPTVISYTSDRPPPPVGPLTPFVSSRLEGNTK